MNYIDSHKWSRRTLIAIAVTLAVNGWLIYALLHGNIYPFAAPEHLIRVRIFPDAKTTKPEHASLPSHVPPAPTPTRR